VEEAAQRSQGGGLPGAWGRGQRSGGRGGRERCRGVAYLAGQWHGRAVRPSRTPRRSRWASVPSSSTETRRTSGPRASPSRIPSTVVVERDPANPRRVLAALKLWTEPDRSRVLILYLPDRVEWWRRPAGPAHLGVRGRVAIRRSRCARRSGTLDPDRSGEPPVVGHRAGRDPGEQAPRGRDGPGRSTSPCLLSWTRSTRRCWTS